MSELPHVIQKYRSEQQRKREPKEVKQTETLG